MRYVAGVLMCIWVGCVFLAGYTLGTMKPPKPFVYDNQVAAGEWHITVQTPPCDNGHIAVIEPHTSGYPLELECDAMPVGEK